MRKYAVKLHQINIPQHPTYYSARVLRETVDGSGIFSDGYLFRVGDEKKYEATQEELERDGWIIVEPPDSISLGWKIHHCACPAGGHFHHCEVVLVLGEDNWFTERRNCEGFSCEEGEDNWASWWDDVLGAGDQSDETA